MRPVARWLPPLLFLGFWLLLMIGGRSKFFRDPGTFWHTRVGEKILTEGFFDTDPYTFTFHGERWIPHQWFGEVAMALVHRVSGFDGLLAVSTGLVAGLFAWMAVRLVRVGFHPLWALLLAGLAMAAGATHFHVRPHLITIIGLAVTVAAVADVDAGRARVRRLWWLVPLYLVWSNTHGGMLGGLTTLGLVGLGWGGLWLLGRPPLRGMWDVVELAAIGLACGLTAFVTPYGADIPRTWLDIMQATRLREIIQEHAPSDFTDPKTWPVLALAGLYLFLLAGTRPGDWRVSWLLPIFWFFQAYARVRHAPLFAVTTCVILADVWPVTRWAGWLAARRPEYYDPQGVAVGWGWRGSLTAAVMVLVVLAVQAARVPVPVVGAGWVRLDPTHWPTDLTETLRAHEPGPGEPNRLFNDFLYGGFVIYHAPGYRVFVDDRCELFGEDWLFHLIQARSGDPESALAEWQAKYGRFDFALTESGGRLDRYFRSRPNEWERLGPDSPTASFYRRRAPAAGQ